jgi:hypothetical protein
MVLEPSLMSLSQAKRVLIAGAGGGFDVMCGIPLALKLMEMGKEVHLANLTFSYMGGSDARMLAPGLYQVRSDTEGDQRYFPEKHLAAWLARRGLEDCVYLFDKVGLQPMVKNYRTLCEQLRPDALVLVDGGTDILMHGDEVGLGTPAEDITSLLAAQQVAVPTKLVCCVGFGIDAFHGVVHADFLENVARLTKAGACFGVHALVPQAAEVQGYLEALAYVHEHTPGRESIVNTSIADAIRGEFGDFHSLERTRGSGSELFINPLMSLVWTFDLVAVAQQCHYRDSLAHTQTIFEVSAAIEGYRRSIQPRRRRPLPM